MIWYCASYPSSDHPDLISTFPFLSVPSLGFWVKGDILRQSKKRILEMEFCIYFILSCVHLRKQPTVGKTNSDVHVSLGSDKTISFLTSLFLEVLTDSHRWQSIELRFTNSDLISSLTSSHNSVSSLSIFCVTMIASILF